MKWLVTLLWLGPGVALDWYDAAGKIDHGKAFGDIVIFSLLLATCYVAVRRHQFPPTMLAIGLVAGALGSRVLIAIFAHRDGDDAK